MAQVEWMVVFDKSDTSGWFTHQIKWIPPQGSGCIVQHVEVVDPLEILRAYKKPYYEAWLIEDGVVLHDGYGNEEYDDSFTNEGDGELLILKHQAIEIVQNSLKKAGCKSSYVEFRCMTYWVEKETSIYEKVKAWKRGSEAGIMMANQLRASYFSPGELDNGKARYYRTDFEIREDVQ